jgi:HAD superfamily hydrolase (TIGR01509 family)
VVRAAIFDVDGTLLDSNELHVQAWWRAFHDFGIEVALPALRDQMGNGGDRLVATLCSADQAAELSDSLIERHVEIFARDYLHKLRPFPGVRELFERLQGDGVRIALASSAQEWERDRHIEILGIADLLDTCTSGEAAEHTKPAPDIFRAALAGIPGAAAHEAVVLGDSPYDAIAARRAGMQALGLLSGGFSKRQLWDAGAKVVFRDVADLLGVYNATPFGRQSPRAAAGELRA